MMALSLRDGIRFLSELDELQQHAEVLLGILQDARRELGDLLLPSNDELILLRSSQDSSLGLVLGLGLMAEILGSVLVIPAVVHVAVLLAVCVGVVVFVAVVVVLGVILELDARQTIVVFVVVHVDQPASLGSNGQAIGRDIASLVPVVDAAWLLKLLALLTFAVAVAGTIIAVVLVLFVIVIVVFMTIVMFGSASLALVLLFLAFAASCIELLAILSILNHTIAFGSSLGLKLIGIEPRQKLHEGAVVLEERKVLIVDVVFLDLVAMSCVRADGTLAIMALVAVLLLGVARALLLLLLLLLLCLLLGLEARGCLRVGGLLALVGLLGVLTRARCLAFECLHRYSHTYTHICA